jgi:hypothetical protein
MVRNVTVLSEDRSKHDNNWSLFWLEEQLFSSCYAETNITCLVQGFFCYMTRVYSCSAKYPKLVCVFGSACLASTPRGTVAIQLSSRPQCEKHEIVDSRGKGGGKREENGRSLSLLLSKSSPIKNKICTSSAQGLFCV